MARPEIVHRKGSRVRIADLDLAGEVVDTHRSMRVRRNDGSGGMAEIVVGEDEKLPSDAVVEEYLSYCVRRPLSRGGEENPASDVETVDVWVTPDRVEKA